MERGCLPKGILQEGAAMLQEPLLGQNGFLGEVVTPSIIAGSNTGACSAASTSTEGESFPGAALEV